MSKRIEALKASIAKWKGNSQLKRSGDLNLGARECPLCQEYIREGCTGCPVFSYTGKPACEGTPYQGVRMFHSNPDTFPIRGVFLAAILEEVKFLESLLDPAVISARLEFLLRFIESPRYRELDPMVRERADVMAGALMDWKKEIEHERQ